MVSSHYLHGVIKEGYFPTKGTRFYVGEASGGGGSRKNGLADPLQVIDLTGKTQGKLIKKIKAFCKENKLIFEKVKLTDDER